jgi:ABC-type antimicrobial peptide transport system permease subunit
MLSIAIATAVVVLLAAATAAALFPSLRALRIDPAEMLKQS